ncbi:DUF6313 family protein [Streptomyces sp. NPDC002742]|uniref:DUF6313 family protein n=1 Tax=Streptomyces sp. NPDC002742 TaxID=3364663 RepID=UPI0036BA5F10
MVGETLGKIGFWLVRKAWWVLCVIVVLFIINLIWGPGWPDTWEILVGRKTAVGAPLPGLSWPLSIVGWAVVPAFIGGVAAFVIAEQAGKRRSGKPAREEALNMRRGGPQ